MSELPRMRPSAKGNDGENAGRDRESPLSKGQLELWMMHEILEDKSVNNLVSLLRVSESVDYLFIKTLVDVLLKKHSAWRTSFHLAEGRPFQRVQSCFETPLTAMDCRSWDHAAFEQWLAKESTVPFELSQGAFRAYFLTHCPYDSQKKAGNLLIIMSHHIVADFASVDLYTAELNQLYRAAIQGESDACLGETPTFCDFVDYEQALFQEDFSHALKQYWADNLKALPPQDALLYDALPGADAEQRAGSLKADIPPAITDPLRALGRSLSATPYLTLLSAFYVFLHRYGGSSDLVVGTPVSIKPKEFRHTIGYFVNLLPLRVRLDGQEGFCDVVAKVRQAVEGATKHRQMPFGDIVRAANVSSNRDGAFFQTAFAWERIKRSPQSAAPEPNLVQETLASYQMGTQNPLMLSVYDDSTTLGLLWNYNAGLFKEDTVQRMSCNFLRLLESLVQEEGVSIDRLPLLTEEETRRLLRDFNSTDLPVPPKDLSALFEAQVRRTPGSVAVLQGDRRLTYAELSQNVDFWSNHLRCAGIGPGCLVALCMERCLDMVVGLLAILKAGAAYVPMDPTHPVGRLQCILEDSCPSVMLTTGNCLAQIELEPQGIPVISMDQPIGALEIKKQVLATGDLKGLEGLAYVIFTSGSTGKPKGVMVEQRGVVNFLVSMQALLNLTPDDRILALTTMAFDISVLEMFLPLITGASLSLADKNEATDPVVLGKKVREDGITLMQATPATWRMLLDAGWEGNTSMKALCGGEAMTTELSSRLSGKVGQLWNVYGPTETTVWSSACRLQDGGSGSARIHEPIGFPMGNTRVYILDPLGQPVPLGAVGEIYIGGQGVARGYLNNAALTAERFLPDPFSDTPGERFYKTGDLGRWLPDGRAECLGRNDFQVKIRGFRIELGEIESRLSEHPDIDEVVVIAREDVPGEKCLVAYYRTEKSLSAETLRNYLSSGLPDYMLPSAYVPINALPMSSNGKLDRRALPVPEGKAYASAGYEAPQGVVETALAAMWSELLTIERVGRHDDFFHLGGHSILATRLVTQINAQLDVHIALVDVFKHKTIATLSEVILRKKIARFNLDAIKAAMEKM